jgi:hypothetical protein
MTPYTLSSDFVYKPALLHQPDTLSSLELPTCKYAMKSLLLAFCLSFPAVLAVGDEPIEYNRDIRPILSDNCFACHGPSKTARKGRLRLNVPDGEFGALTRRNDRNIIQPGKPDDSELWYRITTDDEDDLMPPEDSHKKPLSTEQRTRIKQWIIEGGEYQDFWSFIPPKNSPAPKINNEAWDKTFIDRHIMARLEKSGLQPKPEADKRTLLRRVTFDLTGLPPTLKEIDSFVKDDRPKAYVKLVDRLLRRKSYGEHMTRYWADLVRLGDTNGMHKDFPRDFSTYRDWLIRSFNENLPFDDFIKYQLAGDLYKKPSRDHLVASGFNRLHLIIDAGTALPEESHHKNVLDRVEAFGTTFLGMTVQCAQCHDHKYDPISQKEYFQLYAFFNNFSGKPETVDTPERGLQEPFINLSTAKQERKLNGLKADTERLRKKLAAIQEQETDTKKEERSTEKIEKIEIEIKDKEESMKTLLAGIPGAMVMREKEPPRPATLLTRGAYDAPGEPVERNTPDFLPSMKEKDSTYSRMDLADWLVQPDHPLTARVAVNRIWQQFLGTGIVKTAENFGAQGDWPSHPALLDDLALQFVESGWNLKALVRMIVLSNTYRQSSDAQAEDYVNDPENRLLARGARYRMDAEMIRDQILSVSEQLNATMYGKSVKPPQPPGLWEMVSMAEPKTYVADTGDKIYRRSLYTYWRRGMPPPQMTIMNAPSREFCLARRERTNTPLQALLLMNEEEYFKAARMCATWILAREQDVDTGLRLLYEKITSQVPQPDRLKFMKDTLAEFIDLYKNDPTLTEALTQNLGDSKFEDRVDLAAWTMMTHSLLNLELAKVRR